MACAAAGRSKNCIDSVIGEPSTATAGTLAGSRELDATTTAIIGGSVGGGLCCLATLVVALAILRRRRHEKKATDLPDFASPMMAVQMDEFNSARPEAVSVSEFSSARQEPVDETGRDDAGALVQIGRGYAAIPDSISGGSNGNVSVGNGYQDVPAMTTTPVVLGQGYTNVPHEVASSAGSIKSVGSLKLPPAPPSHSHGGTFSSYASGHEDHGDDLPTLHL
jgi:hypothetical protein